MAAGQGDEWPRRPASSAGRGAGSLTELPDTLRGLVAARLDGLSPTSATCSRTPPCGAAAGPLEALDIMAQQMHGTADDVGGPAGAWWPTGDPASSTASGGRSATTSSARSPTARSPRPTGPGATPASPVTSRRRSRNRDEADDAPSTSSPTTTAAAAELAAGPGHVDQRAGRHRRRGPLDWLREAARPGRRSPRRCRSRPGCSARPCACSTPTDVEPGASSCCWAGRRPRRSCAASDEARRRRRRGAARWPSCSSRSPRRAACSCWARSSRRAVISTARSTTLAEARRPVPRRRRPQGACRTR